MYSSEDLERFYFQYKTEALPHGESIQNFCVRNKVPYNIFSKWYKDTRKKIVEVKVDGMPSDTETLPSAPGGAPASVPASSSPVRILVEIHPIDNNIAERTIRKLTTQRNNSLHYGSDAGVEMAVAYHSIISTVKLHGMSCWRYLGEFFKNIFNGCRDFLSLTPANIGLSSISC